MSDAVEKCTDGYSRYFLIKSSNGYNSNEIGCDITKIFYLPSFARTYWRILIITEIIFDDTYCQNIIAFAIFHTVCSDAV